MENTANKETSTRYELQRRVMVLAWERYRDGEGRTRFALCLKGAWKWMLSLRKEARKLLRLAKGGTVRFSPDLTRSPIRRALRGPYAGPRAATASRWTSRLGR
jgi:hypothetical protein